ncbi:unnamed protein product, partial [Ascophyllum nodosum]
DEGNGGVKAERVQSRSLTVRLQRTKTRPRWIVQPTYGARPGRASSTWRHRASRIVMGRGQWRG